MDNQWRVLMEKEREEFRRLVQQELPRRVDRVMMELGIRFWKGDGARLMIWLSWARALEVELEWLVREVVGEYRRRLRRQGDALGVKMETLTGREAWLWIREQAGKLQRERMGATSQQQGRALATSGVSLVRDPEEYQRRAEEQRRQRRTQEGHPRQRVYRGGPGWRKRKVSEKDRVVETVL